MKYNINQVIEVLRSVVHPGLQKDVVTLEMVQGLEISETLIHFHLIFASAKDPLKNSLQKACTKALQTAFGANIQVNIQIGDKQVHQPKQEYKPLPLQVKNLVAIASGKGGVGKSTIAVNLAVALAKQGYRVGLLDADVFGPSIPKMFQVENERPEVIHKNGKDVVVPVEKYGVKLISIGFFVKPEDAVIWRGAMATSALNQFINDSDWGKLDFLLIDLPPGTSDIHLTLVQTIPVTGAIIVSTPQDVAIADAIKGISMFRNDKINVPILGIVENMSWFTPEELPENKYYIFGKDGCKKLAEQYNVELLAQIPLVQSIRENGDSGIPSALNEASLTGIAFASLAENVLRKIEERKLLQPTTIVETANTDGSST